MLERNIIIADIKDIKIPKMIRAKPMKNIIGISGIAGSTANIKC